MHYVTPMFHAAIKIIKESGRRNRSNEWANKKLIDLGRASLGKGWESSTAIKTARRPLVSLDIVSDRTLLAPVVHREVEV